MINFIYKQHKTAANSDTEPATMDAASTLEQYSQDTTNLPIELQHLLQELGYEDSNLYEIRKRISQKDSAIHKFIKQHGSLTKNPKEGQLYPKISEDFKKAEELQKEKCILANTALYVTTRHLLKLEKDLEKLKSEGLLVHDESEFEFDDDLFSSRGTSRGGTVGLTNFSSGSNLNSNGNSGALSTGYNTGNNGSSSGNGMDDKKLRKSMNGLKSSGISTNSTGSSRPPKRSHLESEMNDISSVNHLPPSLKSNRPPMSNREDGNEDENEVYCYCRGVSYGAMVGCDNDDCRYEWFHYGCVGLTEPPKGKWYCKECTEKMKLKENKKKRKV